MSHFPKPYLNTYEDAAFSGVSYDRLQITSKIKWQDLIKKPPTNHEPKPQSNPQATHYAMGFSDRAETLCLGKG